MSFAECAVILLAGVAAGTINTVVGSGTLITFPTLLAFGVPPVTANVSNTLGLVPGSLSGAWGYRAELVGQRARIIRFGIASALGAVIGALLLLVLPSSAFRAIVPVLIFIGVTLVLLGPRLTARLEARAGDRDRPSHGSGWVAPAVMGAGVYGGYFGAAQGVIVLGIFGVGLDDTLQRQNALKNIVVPCANATAAVVFAFSGRIDWLIVLLLAVGATVGGQIGSTVGRKLPPPLLRGVIVLVGVVALVSFFM
ncbi:MAG: sulfite exporter TauE/SafE family protein [Marmoricola sp.]|nr:sulfite exporter TauE/SafE family protein [Marmoricola sp.]